MFFFFQRSIINKYPAVLPTHGMSDTLFHPKLDKILPKKKKRKASGIDNLHELNPLRVEQATYKRTNEGEKIQQTVKEREGKRGKVIEQTKWKCKNV